MLSKQLKPFSLHNTFPSAWYTFNKKRELFMDAILLSDCCLTLPLHV